eukprot:COSAG01_NODE_790_length_13572_cov_4.015587_13_plen_144_part_00
MQSPAPSLLTCVRLVCSRDNAGLKSLTESIDLSSSPAKIFTAALTTVMIAPEHLARLNHLDLSQNKLEGSIPNSFSKLTSLQYANLQGNELRFVRSFSLTRRTNILCYYRVMSENDHSALLQRSPADLDGRNATVHQPAAAAE